MSRRYPVRDQIAIVGVGTTPFSRNAEKSDVALAVEASQEQPFAMPALRRTISTASPPRCSRPR